MDNNMSRREWHNDIYRFVAGVDHIVGPFVQIYLQPYKEPSLCIDDSRFEVNYPELPIQLGLFVKTLTRESVYDEAIVVKIARLLGFGVDKAIYELWD